MHSIRLNINDKVYKKVLWFLNKFGKDEIEIIFDESEEENSFIENQKYLAGELEEILSGKARFLSEEEAEYRLEKIIKEHEDRL